MRVTGRLVNVKKSNAKVFHYNTYAILSYAQAESSNMLSICKQSI